MITANWRIQCNVDCPYCEHTIDLVSDVRDSFEWLPQPGHSCEIEVEIDCHKCNREFIVQSTQY